MEGMVDCLSSEVRIEGTLKRHTSERVYQKLHMRLQVAADTYMEALPNIVLPYSY
jgi:hypothetical protein